MIFEAEVRLLEIYNEALTDLLHDDVKRKNKISIQEDAAGKNVISGLVREPVKSAGRGVLSTDVVVNFVRLLVRRTPTLKHQHSNTITRIQVLQ